MDVTNELRILLSNAITAKGITQDDFSRAVSRSPSWTSKLLGWTKVRITDSEVIAIEKVLSIELARVAQPKGHLSPLTIEIAALIEKEPEAAWIISALMKASAARLQRLKKRRREIGEGILKAVENHPTHPEKVADIAIDLIEGE